MQGLTKENFWDDIEKRYPVAFKNFSEWIDKYKLEVHWDQLFGNGRLMPILDETGNKIGGETKDTKFHDLPFDMQYGIVRRFLCENTLNGVNPKWMQNDNKFFIWRIKRYFILHNDNYTNGTE